MLTNTGQPLIDKIQEVSKALFFGLLAGFLTIKTLNQRVVGSNPTRLTIIFKALRLPAFYFCGINKPHYVAHSVSQTKGVR